ncbi:MAG: hypothetical protein LBE22_12300 [Azoarcus sp.]|jgi:hypothetical protein|nr:hypothetical protein [Azoarcus sp.]
MGRFKNAATKILILAVCFISSVCIGAEDCKMREQNALEILLNASRIESRLIGEGGRESKTHQAFHVLNKRKNASELFNRLYNNSTESAGKVYSLIWFFNNDEGIYYRYKEEYLKNNNTSLEIRIGDIVYNSALEDVFRKIESGELLLLLNM